MEGNLSYAPGTFCWFELSTTDVDSARKMYSELFNWTTREIPISPTDKYVIFSAEGGGDTGAVCPLQQDHPAGPIPPNWLVYMSVANVDESAAKATELGGKILG